MHSTLMRSSYDRAQLFLDTLNCLRRIHGSKIRLAISWWTGRWERKSGEWAGLAFWNTRHPLTRSVALRIAPSLSLELNAQPNKGRAIYFPNWGRRTYPTCAGTCFVETTNGRKNAAFICPHQPWGRQRDFTEQLIGRSWIRRGDQWLAKWNDHPKPFHWTATADVILEKVRHGKELYGTAH